MILNQNLIVKRFFDRAAKIRENGFQVSGFWFLIFVAKRLIGLKLGSFQQLYFKSVMTG